MSISKIYKLIKKIFHDLHLKQFEIFVIIVMHIRNGSSSSLDTVINNYRKKCHVHR